MMTFGLFSYREKQEGHAPSSNLRLNESVELAVTLSLVADIARIDFVTGALWPQSGSVRRTQSGRLSASAVTRRCHLGLGQSPSPSSRSHLSFLSFPLFLASLFSRCFCFTSPGTLIDQLRRAWRL